MTESPGNDTPHWRPRLHFTPARHWINDPNGLVWHDGEYHLFFQHNPHGSTWGHMSWGHAVSTDLLHWQELPVAIPEDDTWMIFSGSVVVDVHNTSGFGDGMRVPMVACYTGHARSGGLQNQQLAFSLDRGRTWTKYAGNPVLDVGKAHFRDPKLFWHDGRSEWLMLVSMADEQYAAFFASPNLRDWRHLSDLHVPLPAACKLWECPDLLRLPVEGSAEHAWVFKVDVFHGHPAGGSGALAVVGDFDGRRFTPTQAPQWVDGGMDFYAAIAFVAMPPGDERCVWLGWMNDHRYAAQQPTAPWCGAMTLPRELTLVRGADGLLRLRQQPLRELLAWRGEPLVRAAGLLAAGRHDLVAPGLLPTAQDVAVAVAAPPGVSWWLDLRADGSVATRVGFSAADGTLFIDRSRSGVLVDEGGYTGIRRLPITPTAAGELQLRIVIDACSVEVFAADGGVVLTELVFPPAAATGVTLHAEAAVELRAFKAWALLSPGPLSRLGGRGLG